MQTQIEKIEKKTMYVDMGKRLRQARIQHGYSQEQIAERLGINTAYYGRVERGISGLTLLNIKKVCEILQLNIHFLVTGYCENKLTYDEMIKSCPATKRYDFEQLIKYALNLMKG